MGASVRHFVGFLKALGKAPYNWSATAVAATWWRAPRISALVESCVLIDATRRRPAPGGTRSCSAQPHKAGTLEASRWTYEHYSCDPARDQCLDRDEAEDHGIAEEQDRDCKDEGRGFLHTRFLPELLEDKDEFFVRLKGRLMADLLFWGYNDPTAPLLGMKLYDLIAKRQPRTSFRIVNQAATTVFASAPPGSIASSPNSSRGWPWQVMLEKPGPQPPGTTPKTPTWARRSGSMWTASARATSTRARASGS
jgi:hypothetical protein